MLESVYFVVIVNYICSMLSMINEYDNDVIV